MKRDKTLLLFLAAIILILAGCTNQSPSVTPESPSPVVSKVVEPPVPPESKDPIATESEAPPTPPKRPGPALSKMKEPPATPEPIPPIIEEVEISIDVLKDELLDKYASFEEFIEFDDEGFQRIIITTNVLVKDFKFIEIGFEERDSNIVLLEDKVLYSLEELSPEKPFLVTWMDQGTIPHRGISFVDESNEVRNFYITMSGEDGSLLLIEF